MKTRQWFQIHLLTAVMLMIVSGAMVGVNLRQSRLPLATDGGGTILYRRGWPCRICQGNEYWETSFVWNFDSEVWVKPGDRGGRYDPIVGMKGQWAIVPIGFNFLFLIALQAAVAVTCERLVRGREKRIQTKNSSLSQ